MAYAAATITGKDAKNGSLNTVDLAAGVLPGATASIVHGGTIPSGATLSYAFESEEYDTGNMFGDTLS